MDKWLRCLFFWGILLCAIPSFADKYANLWKDVEVSRANDLPQTALKSLDRIITLAQKNKDGGHLMKATLLKCQLHQDISPDSALAHISLLEESMIKEKDSVMQSLYHVVLGSLYQMAGNDGDVLKKSIDHLCLSMKHPNILFHAKANAYMPFVIEGETGNYFKGDMLNVVLRYSAKTLAEMQNKQFHTQSLANQLFHVAIQKYRVNQMREAEMFAMLDSADAMNSFRPDKAFLAQMKKSFSDLDVCSEICLRLSSLQTDPEAYETLTNAVRRYPNSRIIGQLQNRILQLEQASLELKIPKNIFCPGSIIEGSVLGKNLENAELVLYKTDFTAQSRELLKYDKKAMKAAMRNIVAKVPVILPRKRPAEESTAKVSFSLPEPGIYLAQIKSDKMVSEPKEIYVSGLHIMSLHMPKQQTRILVSDAVTGAPAKDAKVVFRRTSSNHDVLQTMTTNSDGTILLEKSQYSGCFAFAVNDKDQYCPQHFVSRNYNFGSQPEARQEVLKLYTDRSIYRPGQLVKVGGFLYSQQGADLSVIPSSSLELCLVDANGKELSKQSVVTDAFGSLKAEFLLPSQCLNGTFSVRSVSYGQVSFKVEEYKRPTFTAEFKEVTSSYVLGDTVVLEGEARTLAGFPIINAKVAYVIKRGHSDGGFLRHWSEDQLVQDTILTDEKGCFRIPVMLRVDEKDDNALHFYSFVATARIIADNGETQTASRSLYAGTRPATMSITLSPIVCKEQKMKYTIYHQNAAGQNVDGIARVKLLRKNAVIKQFDSPMNTLLSIDEFSSLPSGKYMLEVVPADRTDTLVMLRHTFQLFSLKDQKIEDEDLLVYTSAQDLSDKKPTTLFFGTSQKDVYLHYDCFTNDRLLESKLIRLDNKTRTIDYTYKDEYEDGINIVLSYVKDGQIRCVSKVLNKQIESKHLSVRWKTFRDRLHPGQHETWTLQVLRKGKPAEASLLATLYDASLDKFCNLDWNFSLRFHSNTQSHFWNYVTLGTSGLSSFSDVRNVSEKYWDFSHFDESLFQLYYPRMYKSVTNGVKIRGKAAPMMALSLESVALQSKMETSSASDAMSKRIAGSDTKTAEKGEEASSESLRTDFSETAFFTSGLVTNDKGELELSFQLPQSVTQWNFKSLVHDKEMNFGQLKDTIVAAKDFMLQANMPRFLRVGDHASIVVSLRNATEKKQQGNVSFEILNPENMAVIYSTQQSFNIAGMKEQTLSFDFTAKDGCPLLICRFVAQGASFSDGEQYYLPVLEDLQEVTDTYPLSFGGAGRQEVVIPEDSPFRSVSSSHRRLTVEYTSNPLWTAVEALPSIVKPLSWNATSLATSFYALTMAATEAQQRPEILLLADSWRKAESVDSLFLLLERNENLKQIVLNETPWVMSANAERSRLEGLAQLYDTITLSMRRQGYLDRLFDLQADDGSWSWFKGMPGNGWVTVDVVETLVRLFDFAPQWKCEKTEAMIGKAMKFLHHDADEWVSRRRKEESKQKTITYVDSRMLRYLYICSLLGVERNASIDFLLKRLETSATHYDMYTKALATRVLARYKHTAAAKQTLQSLLEHTVSSPSMGRYFDSQRAPSFYESYRIPTQVAALEAMALMGKNDEKLEMVQWLLQSKRTQSWNNPVAAVDAIHYLFQEYSMANQKQLSVPQIEVDYPDGSQHPFVASSDVKDISTLGYICKDIPVLTQIPRKVIIQKKDDALSFAGVYAQCAIPVSDVKTASAGLLLNCSYEVQHGEEWTKIGSSAVLHKGDVVRVRYTIHADRDYDFVSLKMGRAACMEPQLMLSGYSWHEGCYREVDDASSQYFFNQLSKGKHVLEDTFTIDRVGIYLTAAPSLQCSYAPEFSARDKAVRLLVE